MRKTYELLTKFKIPLLPPSLNEGYRYSRRAGKPYTTQKVRDFNNTASLFIEAVDIEPETKLRVYVEYHGSFLTKAGKTRVRDGQNLDKFLYDIIFSVLGANDALVWEGAWKKIHSEEIFTYVEIYKITK